MASLIAPVRGMNDVLPDDEALWERLERAANELFKSYDYHRIRIPVLERTELFSRSIGELTDIVEKEMYTFEDRGGDSLTLRPEATAGIVRACLTHGLLHNAQQKLWCAGPMFRREKPQKGRYRQFHQLSVEALGYEEPETDAEQIVLTARLWRSLGLGQSATLELNSIGTPQSRTAYKEELVHHFSAHRELLDADSVRRLERNPMRILDSKNPQMAPLIAAAPVITEYLDEPSREHFERVQRLVQDAGIEARVNPRLVRGLDYYTRTVFEWVTDRLGAQSAICAGGRYDGLVVQLGGKETPAVGFALGVERVVELMRLEETAAPEGPDVFIVSAGEAPRRAAFAAAERLRDQVPGISVSIGSPSAGFKAQMRRADRSGARFAVIIGEDELADGRFGLKPLRADLAQQSLSLDELARQLSLALKQRE